MDAMLGFAEACFWDVGDQQVLPDRQPQGSGAVALGDIAEPAMASTSIASGIPFSFGGGSCLAARRLGITQ